METNVNIPTNREFFANACHVCRAYGKDVRLKRCGDCKMIAYCNREHQAMHWPQHKFLCRILSGNLRDGSIYCLRQFAPNDDQAWSKAKSAALSLVQTVLSYEIGRGILPFELEMLVHPRCCEICHETDFTKLKDCQDCPDTSFCDNHPMDDNHFILCRVSQFSFQTHLASPRFNRIPLSMDYGTSTPKNMGEAVSLFVTHYCVDEIFKSFAIWSAVLSDRLTRPYTFLHAMQMMSQPNRQKIIIHVIGCTSIEMDSVPFWHFLFHHNKNLKELHIVFVSLYLSTAPIATPFCEECMKNNRRLIFQSVAGLYVAFAGQKFFRKPHYIIRFNLEIDTEKHYLSQTVSLLAHIGCPVFVTSYDADTSRRNENTINEVLGKEISPFYTGENPFAGRKPYRDFESGAFYYCNLYLTIYEKLY